MNQLLARQLRRLGLDPDVPPDAEGWRRLLERIARTYDAGERDRYLVERSLQISSAEMARLYEELRRSTESRLEAEGEKLRTVVRSMGDGLCVLDADGRVEFVNPEAERLLGMTAGELAGRELTGVVSVVAGDADGDFAEALRAHRPWRAEDAHFVLAGGEFAAASVLNPIEGADGPSGAVLVFRDIGERRRNERELRRQHEFTAALLASMQDGLTVLAPDGTLIEVSPSFCAMTGFSRDELIGAQAPFPYWPEAVPERVQAGLRRIRETGAGEWDLTFTRRDGARFPVILSCSLMRAADGTVVGYLGAVKDVTERKRAEERLRASEAEQAALRRVATAVASEVDPQTIFSLVAETVADLFAVECGLVAAFEGDQARTVGWWGQGRPAPSVRFALTGSGALAEVARTGRACRVDDYEGIREDETGRIVLRSGYRTGIAAPVLVGSSPWGAVLVASAEQGRLAPESEERLAKFAELVGVALANADARSRLAERAATDHLTGLPNHRSFHERLAAEVARARHHGRQLSIAVLDLDHFKQVNDAHGHQVGDMVLREAARRLGEQARPGEIVARVGGEEFAWILPECDGMEAFAAAERARQAISSTPFPVVGRVTVSAGVCDLRQAGTPGELYRLADGALYWAKAHGRDTCVRYTPEAVEVLSAEERADRRERLQALATVRALARAVDAKDTSTHRHSERVASLAEQLARTRGWSADRAARLREAGLVHDVGKIGVPDAILFKLGPLTADEYEQVKQHAALGGQIVSGALSPEQVDWVRHHHERYDGRGYPDGLAGEAIPEGACLLALADAWDAMTMARHYSPPTPPEKALEECRRQSGRQFSPAAVEALLRLWDAGALAVSPDLERLSG